MCMYICSNNLSICISIHPGQLNMKYFRLQCSFSVLLMNKTKMTKITKTYKMDKEDKEEKDNKDDKDV